MSLENISSTKNPATASLTRNSTDKDTDAGKSALDLDTASFLKLLVTQLKNQDPTNPTDTNAYTQQIASLSQVEQQTNTNTKLDKLIGLQSGVAVSAQLSSAVNYIGKVAQVKGDTFSIQNTGDAKFSYDVPAGAVKSTITITNSNGTVIGAFAGKITEGKHNVEWDATDADGKRVPVGDYKVSVSVVDSKGEGSKAETYIYNRVNSVQVDGGKTNVVLDQGQVVSIEGVLSVE